MDKFRLIQPCGNEEKRDKLLSDFGLDGGQKYQLDNEQAQALFDVFQFNGTHYLMLIAKNGYIIERGNQLSPSMKLTEEKITELLHKPLLSGMEK